MRRGLLAGLAALAAVTAATAFGAHQPAGSLRQVSGLDGCYTQDGTSEDGPGDCRDIRGGTIGTAVAFSPDRHFAYLSAYGDFSQVPPTLSIFKVHKDGSLHQLSGKKGCLSVDGSSSDGPHTCTKVRTLDTSDGPPPAISRDGRFLYLAGQAEGPSDFSGVAVFKRDTKDGTLKQLSGKAGCVDPDATHGCAAGREINSVGGLVLSPDEHYLYASDYSGSHRGVAVFRRNSKTGKIRQLSGKNGCITADGKTDTSAGATVCRAGYAVSASPDVVAPDNRSVYVVDEPDEAVAVLKRNAKGGLEQLPGKAGCISNTGATTLGGADSCRQAKGLDDVYEIAASKGGRFIYAGGYDDTAPLTVLERKHDGSLEQGSGTGVCTSLDGSSVDGPGTCHDGRDLGGTYSMGLSPDGRTLYVPEFTTDAVTVFRISPRQPVLKQLPGKLGCISEDGSSVDDGPGTCANGRVLAGAYQAIAPGNGHVYVVGANDNGVAVFRAAR